jgi:hypothetical protein
MSHASAASRRAFLRRAAELGAAFAVLGRRGLGQAPGASKAPVEALGPLVTDPAGIFDLPAGFQYTVLSRAGEEMDDGLLVPPRHDGMAAFPGPAGKILLVRNHENLTGTGGAFGPANARLAALALEKVYDRGVPGKACLGGTTTLLFDGAAQKLERQHLSLAGTLFNCAGGATPWGSWISCEETVARAGEGLQRDHGFCFEVPSAALEPVDPRPLTALGRMRHEAIAVEPRSGCLYLTEDVFDGLFYRFVPARAGDLAAGGALQALAVRDAPSLDTRNWHALTRLERAVELEVEWLTLDGVDAPEDDLRARGFLAGAARFARGEGVHFAGDAVWFTCTIGGSKKLGQLWRYRPSPHEGGPKEARERGRLSLFLEPEDEELMQNCDNLCAAPFGHLIVCEDGPANDRILGVAPDGTVYPLGQNRASASELAGVTFAPDGKTLFVNLQEDGLTLAITGPWERAAALG